MKNQYRYKAHWMLALFSCSCFQAFAQGFSPSSMNWGTPFYLEQTSDFSASLKHTTMDMNGDGKPDLVVTYDNGYLGSVGNFRWEVYLNNGAGFSGPPVLWSTPFSLEQITDFTKGFKYTTMDMNGDAKPDLVVTYDNGYLGSVGNFRWEVYVNNGAGFNSTPLAWSTPFALEQITDVAGGFKYTMMDIDGDAKPDLVVTYNNGFIGSVGNFRWDVYVNNGSGFNSAPVSWSTPFNIEQITDFSAGRKHTTMDMDGDDKPDLVVTYNNGYLGSVGNFRWDVYLNSGAGFNGAPVAWSTPFNVGQTTDFSAGRKHTTMDIDGDNKPDLVVTYNNGFLGSVGNFRWDVYLNSGAGFDGMPVGWSTPFNLENVADFSASRKHTTMDLNGDRKPDLIVTSDNGAIGSVGSFRWDVYLNASTVGVNALNKETLTLSVFPNPTNGVVNMLYSHGSFNAVSIYNQYGQVLHETSGLNNSPYRVDLSAYPAGIYFLKVESDERVSTVRVIRK